MTLKQFCEKHNACEPGQTWALANCKTIQEAWDAAPDPEWVVWIATRRGVLTERELRLFICFCARQNWHRLTDPRSRNVVDVAERYANGQASQEELVAAAREARAAVEVVWGTAAWTAERVAADDLIMGEMDAFTPATARFAGRRKRANERIGEQWPRKRTTHVANCT